MLTFVFFARLKSHEVDDEALFEGVRKRVEVLHSAEGCSCARAALKMGHAFPWFLCWK